MRFNNINVELPTPIQGEAYLQLYAGVSNSLRIMGVDPRIANYEVEVKFEYEHKTGDIEYADAALFGGRWSWGGNLCQITNNNYSIALHTNGNPSPYISMEPGSATIVKQALDGFYVNGELKYNYFLHAYDTEDYLTLFGTPNNTDLYFIGKIYYVKIWQDGQLTYDLVPTIDEGIAGLKNKVDNTYLYPELANYTYEIGL